MLHPDLKPAYLDEQSPDPEADGRLTRYMYEAITLNDAGRTAEAIEKYEEYLVIETSAFHREIAEREIKRLAEDEPNGTG